MKFDIAKMYKAVFAAVGAAATSIAALEANAVSTGTRADAVAYLTALVMAVGTGLAVYAKRNAPVKDTAPTPVAPETPQRRADDPGYRPPGSGDRR